MRRCIDRSGPGVALLLGLSLAAGIACAEDAAVPPPPPAATDKSAPTAATKPAATPGAKPASPPATQQRFTPSERVRADFPVSFPTDI